MDKCVCDKWQTFAHLSCMMFAKRGDKSIWLKAQRDRKITQTKSGETFEIICNSISFCFIESDYDSSNRQQSIFSWQIERETEMAKKLRKIIPVGENE